MLLELLIIICIILLVIFLLLFLLPLHVSVRIKNNNLDYNLNIILKILLIKTLLTINPNDKNLAINLQIFNKQFKLYSKDLDQDDELTEENDLEDEEPKDEDTEEETKLIENIKEKINLIIVSKDEIISIIKYLFKLIQFHESLVNVNLGLGDNNLTIKTCNTLLTIFTPLYALNIKVFIIPAINEACIRSDAEISFKIYLINLLKIIITVFKSENLRNLAIQLIK